MNINGEIGMEPTKAVYTIINLTTVIDVLSIILAILALIITIIGFFASLKFYREGVKLQDNANKALIQLVEKTQYIESQVGGMFNKTLDAAIGKQNQMSEEFERIHEQLDKTTKEIIDNAVIQIGTAGEKEREGIKKLVQEHMQPLREKIDTTMATAATMAFPEIDIEKLQELTPREEVLLRFIFDHKEPITSYELSEKFNIHRYGIVRALQSLKSRGYVRQLKNTSPNNYIITKKGKDIFE